MSNMPFTCKDCEARYPGCHAKCEKYLAEKASWEATKKERDKHRTVDEYISDSIHRTMDGKARMTRDHAGYQKRMVRG